MTDFKVVPRTRIGRIAQLAGLGLRTGANKVVGSDPASALRDTAEVLGSLRGLAAKVGQMASYVDGIAPTEHSELYESVMGKLRTQTPISSPAAIREIVGQELGAPVDELYAHWTDEPLASASLGQVHRATLRDGKRVAVKVQHPGIQEALENDLKNLSMLETFTRPLTSRRIDSKAIIDVLHARFRDELDYNLEAKHQHAFALLHHEDHAIRVPAVIAQHSSKRVLTSEFAEGLTLEEAREQPESVRRSYAETLWRFVFRGNFVGQAFNADPHPGNYVFQRNGHVTFLDFGCVQPLEDRLYTCSLAQYESALRGDEASFRQATATLYRTDQAPLHDHIRECFEPVFAPGHFHITREYAASLFQGSSEMVKKIQGKSEAPPEITLFNRLQFGFYSVLARLDVSADYAAVSRSVLAERAAPPMVPLTAPAAQR